MRRTKGVSFYFKWLEGMTKISFSLKNYHRGTEILIYLGKTRAKMLLDAFIIQLPQNIIIRLLTIKIISNQIPDLEKKHLD